MNGRVDFDPSRYRAAPDLLAGRCVLVTGAGDGLGRAGAEALAAAGATVILLGRTLRKLEACYDAIEGGGGPRPAIYPLDLAGATYQDYERLAADIEREFGRLDALVLNAAALGELAPLARYEPTLWARVMHVNLNAAFMLTQNLFPLLERADDAAVIAVTDQAVERGAAYWGAYAVSKAALGAFAATLAAECESKPRLRVHALDPGPTATALRRRAFPAEDPRRLPSPAEVAPAYVYLVGPDGRDLRGITLAARPNTA